jgi:hypothetical protein
MIILSHRIFLLDEVFVSYNLHFGVSGGFFQGAKLRTLVYVIGVRFSNRGWLRGLILVKEDKRKLGFAGRVGVLKVEMVKEMDFQKKLHPSFCFLKSTRESGKFSIH